MILDDLEIEKNLKKLKENYNTNKKSSSKKTFIKDTRIWTQKTKVYISNILFDINRKVKYIEKEKLLLNEIEDINSDDINSINTNSNNKIKTKNKLDKKNKNLEEKPIKIYKGITSENYNNILKKAYNKLNQIKEESKEVQKFNGLGLQHMSSIYFRTSRPNSATIPKQKIYKKNRPTSASTYYESKMLGMNNNKSSNLANKSKYKTINSSHRSFRTGFKFKQSKLKFKQKNNNEKKLMDLRYINLDKMYKESNKREVNLGRLNDVYRLELNKALNMYSPLRHLKDMKQIQIEDQDVRQEMFDINRQIDEKIDERCKGLYFKREYEKYILKNKKNIIKSKASKSMNNSYNKNKSQIQAGSFRLRANYSSRNLFDPKVNSIFQENLNNEQKKKISQREKIEKKLENLREILDYLGDTLNIDPIHQYINDESKMNRKKLIKKDMIEIQKEYFPKLDEVNQNIKEVIGEEEQKENLQIEKDELEYELIKTQDEIAKHIVHNNSSQKYEK